MTTRTPIPASRPLVAFVTAVDLLGVAALMTLPDGSLAGGGWPLLVVAALAALVGARPVRVPPLRMEVTATQPFVLLALAALGPTAAAVVALAAVGGAALGRGKRPAVIKLAFNLGAVALSAAAAGWTFVALGGGAGRSLVALMIPLVAATAGYFLVNTGLVAAAIAMERQQAFVRTWTRSCGWTAASFFAGLTLAVAMLALLEASLPWSMVLGLPGCAMLLAFYRAYAVKVRFEQTG